MHCCPERMRKFIEATPGAAPQTQRELRHRAELLDASPVVARRRPSSAVVGLVPGVTAKKTIASRDCHARHMKRMGFLKASYRCVRNCFEKVNGKL
jgi:hypothetical protein